MPSSLPSFTNNNNILTIAESLKNNTLLYKFRNLRPPDFLCWPETWFHNPTPSHAPTLDTWKDFTLPPTIVSYPARWSFSLILGPLHWRLIVSDPAVDRIGRFWPFFLQNVSFIQVTKPQNLFRMVWRYFPQNQPGKLTLGVFQKLLCNSAKSESLLFC